MKGKKRDFDGAAASWDEPQRVRMAGDIASAILEEVTVTPEMDVLDFGCGTGLLTLHFPPLARSVTGVDSSPGMLAVLTKKIDEQDLANVNVRRLDLDRGETLEGSYDLITSSMTFHHIRDIPALLNLLFETTAPGGHLCVADLDPDGGRFHGDNQDGVFHDGFDRAEMRRMFVSAGFKDVRARTAATVEKPVPGGMGKFTIFLVTGRKP